LKLRNSVNALQDSVELGLVFYIDRKISADLGSIGEIPLQLPGHDGVECIGAFVANIVIDVLHPFHADVGHQRAIGVFRKPLKSPAKKEASVGIPIKALNSLLRRKSSVTVPQNTESSGSGILGRRFLSRRLLSLFLDLLLGL